MVNIRCDDYGFDCDYTMNGEFDEVVFEYLEHMNDEHGIEYSAETVSKYLKNKLPKNVQTN